MTGDPADWIAIVVVFAASGFGSGILATVIRGGYRK